MIVFCGYANSDVTVNLPALPGSGDRVHAHALLRHDGGMGANAAIAAARLGAHVGFAGVVGDDPLSTAFLEALAADGVDVSLTARDGTLTTAVVLVTEDGQRSIISQDDALTPDRVAEVVRWAREAGVDWLYLDGYRFPSAAAVLEDEPKLRAVVDLDGCETAEAARAAVRVAEHVVTGREQAERLLADAPATLALAWDTHVLITDGARGWRLHTPDGATHTGAALDVPVRDTTGAGDCFVGAYLAELERGSEPPNAARFAAVAAGLSCTESGARAGIPTHAEVIAALGGTAG